MQREATKVLPSLWFLQCVHQCLPSLLKKRGEFSLRGQAECLQENPSDADVLLSLRENGLIPFAETDSYESPELNELFIYNDGDARPFVKIQILGREIIGLLDSGAERSVLGRGAEKLLQSLRITIKPSTTTLVNAAGNSIPVIGCVDLPVYFDNQVKIIPMIVAPKLNRRLILGAGDFWRAFNIRPTVQTTVEVDEIEQPETELILTDQQINDLEKVKKMFKVAVEGEYLDTTPLITHQIEFKDEFQNSPPIRINPYPTSPQMQSKINTELDKLISQQVVERSHSDWSLSTVPVVKPNGEVRLCLDARRLNERTQRDAYPLPHQDRILSRLGNESFSANITRTQITEIYGFLGAG